MSRESMTRRQEWKALLKSFVLPCLKSLSADPCFSLFGIVTQSPVQSVQGMRVNCQPCALGPEKPEGHLPPQVLQSPPSTLSWCNLKPSRVLLHDGTALQRPGLAEELCLWSNIDTDGASQETCPINVLRDRCQAPGVYLCVSPKSVFCIEPDARLHIVCSKGISGTIELDLTV